MEPNITPPTASMDPILPEVVLNGNSTQDHNGNRQSDAQNASTQDLQSRNDQSMVDKAADPNKDTGGIAAVNASGTGIVDFVPAAIADQMRPANVQATEDIAMTRSEGLGTAQPANVSPEMVYNNVTKTDVELAPNPSLGQGLPEEASRDVATATEPLCVASQVDATVGRSFQTLDTSSSILATTTDREHRSQQQQDFASAVRTSDQTAASSATSDTETPFNTEQSKEARVRGCTAGDNNISLQKRRNSHPANSLTIEQLSPSAYQSFPRSPFIETRAFSAPPEPVSQPHSALVAHKPASQHQLTDEDYDALLNMVGTAEEALTKGSLLRVYQNEQVHEPVVQCVLVKPMPDNGQGGQRYRVVWSDSVNYIQSMITQQNSYLVSENKLQKGSICKLKQFQANVVKDKTILIVIELEVLEEYGEPPKIGNPAALDGPKQEEAPETKPQTENINSNNFYGKQNGSAQPQARALPTRTSSSHGNITPIEAVSPYSHKWTIKARCTHKSPIKKWHKNTGEGQLFSCNFLDESGEIRATGFNTEVDRLYEMIQEGNVYYVSAPCKVNFAKRQFSNVNNDYELTFERDTQVEKAEDMDGVPQVRYNFTSLEDLQSVEKDTTIDCIGVLQDIGEVSEIVSKTTSKPYQKRELTLVDNTGYNVRLTIWGASAQSFEAEPASVVAFKGVKVSDFGGRSLSLLSSGSMTINPDIEDAFKLKGWYSAEGQQTQFQSHANAMSMAGATSGGKNAEYKTIGQVGEENLGMNPSGDADWFTIKATVLYVRKENISYPACRSEGCNKKVISTDPNEWRCERCDKTWDKPQWRYVLSVNVADHTGQLWLSCFDDTGRIIMGMTADEVQAIRDEEGTDTPRVEAIFSSAFCKSYIFRCKAKMDSFNDQQRVRYQAQTCSVPNYGAEANKLANLIKQYNIDGDSLFVN